MNNSNGGLAWAPALKPPKTNFQSMEDFQMEEDKREVIREVNKREALPPTRKKQKQKPVVDDEAIALERKAVEETGTINWIGRLTEYRAAHPMGSEALQYLESFVGSITTPKFTCTVIIAETSEAFGGHAVSFSNKKTAKSYASKKAIDWLVENKKMPGDGTVKFPKVSQPQLPQPALDASSSSTDLSYASQVPILCHRLGITGPKYEITPVSQGTALYDGYADFGPDPNIEGRVGVVKNIFGKKNAKEEVARIVVYFLKHVEEQRMQGSRVDDRKRRRSSESSRSEEWHDC